LLRQQDAPEPFAFLDDKFQFPQQCDFFISDFVFPRAETCDVLLPTFFFFFCDHALLDKNTRQYSTGK